MAFGGVVTLPANWRETWSGTAKTSHTTAAAYTRLAGRAYLGIVVTTLGSYAGGVADLVDAIDGTPWTLVRQLAHAGNNVRQLAVFRITGAAASTALTFTNGGGGNTFAALHIVVVEATLANLAALIAQTPPVLDNGNTATPSIAVTPVDGVNNLFIGVHAIFGGGYTALPGSGWTELSEQVLVGGCSLYLQSRTTGDTASPITWDGANNTTGMVLEIAAAPAATAVALILQQIIRFLRRL